MTARMIIQEHLQTRQRETGFCLPLGLEQYLVDLVTDRLDRTDIIPQPSFGERYLELYHTSRPGEIRDYADQCLFFVSLLPDYGRRRGLNLDYYATLGISAYYSYSDLVGDDRFTQLGNWFYHLQRFLNSAIRPQGLMIPELQQFWLDLK